MVAKYLKKSVDEVIAVDNERENLVAQCRKLSIGFQPVSSFAEDAKRFRNDRNVFKAMMKKEICRVRLVYEVIRRLSNWKSNCEVEKRK